MKIQLVGRTALVCGSSQGIGRAIAKQFAECGATVILAARDASALDSVLRELKGSGHRSLVVDFNDSTSVEYVCSELTTQGIDILVNNSGGPAGGSLMSAESHDFVLAMQRLLLSSHVLSRACTGAMKKNQWGRIINIISTSVKQPIDNLGVSNTIRGATASWAKTLSRELAPYGITVNNILPGATLTGRLESIIDNTVAKTGKTKDEVEKSMLSEIPAGRFARAEEIAYATAFLASDYAQYITGTNLTVDGGRTKAL